MRCLVVGGTGYLAGAIADVLAAAGHAVTILSRGSTLRDSPLGAALIRADRHGDLGMLRGQEFDWVFDTCAFAPDAVMSLLTALGGRISAATW